MNKHTKDIAIFTPHILLPFPNLMPTLPTMQLTHCVTSLEVLYQIMSLNINVKIMSSGF